MLELEHCEQIVLSYRINWSEQMVAPVKVTLPSQFLLSLHALPAYSPTARLPPDERGLESNGEEPAQLP